jgi:6-phosphogluconolactonase (cycloisomerase 2 family)
MYVVLISLLGGCGGGSSPPAPSAYTIGGTITGLNGAVTLRNNGGNDLTVSANGAFAFATPLAPGASYAVTVAVQPTSPVQNCVVVAGGGAVGSANVASIAVTCTTSAVFVGGSVSGLSGSGLTLQINGGNLLGVAANGSFGFNASLPPGSPYLIEVATQPGSPTQVCTVDAAAGVTGSANIANAHITCNSGVSRFVYAANFASASVAAYAVNATSGALTPIAGSPFATGSQPRRILVAPDGKHLYVQESSNGFISAFSIDQLSGALMPVAGSPFAVGTHHALASMSYSIARAYISRSGRYLAAVTRSQAPGGNDKIHLFAISPVTGALSQVPGSPVVSGVGNVSSLVLDAHDRMVYVVANTRVIPPSIMQDSQISAYRINVATGSLTLVGAPLPLESGGANCTGEPWDTASYHAPSNSLYVLGLAGVSPSVRRVAVDPVTGSMSIAASHAQSGPLVCLPGVRVDGAGTAFLGSGLLPGFSINGTTGELTALTTAVSFTFMASDDVVHDVTPSGGFVYVPSNSTTFGLRGYRINTIAGSLDLIPGSPFHSTAATYQAVVDRSGKYLYVSQGSPGSVLAYSIDGNAGTLTFIGSAAAGASTLALAVAGTQ